MIKCSFPLIPHFSKGAKEIAPSSCLQVKNRDVGQDLMERKCTSDSVARMHHVQKILIFSVPSFFWYLFSSSFVNSLKVPVKFTKAVTPGNNPTHSHNHGLAGGPSPIYHEMFPGAASPALIYFAWAKSSSGKTQTLRRVPSLSLTCSEEIRKLNPSSPAQSLGT